MSDDELRRRQERAFYLEELTQHTGWGVLVEEIQGLMDHELALLGRGYAKTIEQYREYVGGITRGEEIMHLPEAARELVDNELKRRVARGE